MAEPHRLKPRWCTVSIKLAAGSRPFENLFRENVRRTRNKRIVKFQTKLKPRANGRNQMDRLCVIGEKPHVKILTVMYPEQKVTGFV